MDDSLTPPPEREGEGGGESEGEGRGSKVVAFVRELNKETIHLPLGCLQGGSFSPFPAHTTCVATAGGTTGKVARWQVRKSSINSGH